MTSTSSSSSRESILKILHQVGGPACNESESKYTVLMENLRKASADWNDDFDGNKMILMVDDFDNNPQSKFEGGKDDVLDFLKEAKDAGVPLEWKLGSVYYRIYGYGMGPPWDMEWNDEGGDSHKITLHLHEDAENFDECTDYFDDEDEDIMEDHEDFIDGCVTMNWDTEMVPTDYYDTKDYEENFEATYHGVLGKRRFDNETALVVWPSSWNWKVLANGDLHEMCCTLLKETPDAARAKELSEMVLSHDSGIYGSGRKAVVSRTIEVLIAANDRDVALSFWNQYLSQEKEKDRVPDAVVTHLKGFLSQFGPITHSAFLDAAVTTKAMKQYKNGAFEFLASSVEAIAGDHPILCRQLVEKALESIDRDSHIEADSVTAFFDMIETTGSSIFEDISKPVASFLNNIAKMPCYHPSKVHKRCPMLLLSTNLPRICAAADWKNMETPLETVITKLDSDGNILQGLKLVKELAGSNLEQIDHSSNHFRVCSALASRVIQGSLTALMSTPNVSLLQDLLCVAEEFCPKEYIQILNAVEKLDVDKVVAPLALSLNEYSKNQNLQGAALKLSSRCVPILKERVSKPLADTIDWAMSVNVVETQVEKERINGFLANPCHGSMSFELALYSHEQILIDLAPLIASGHIKAYPSRPSGRGRWSIKIDKLRNQKRPLESVKSMQCSCSRWFSSCSEICLIDSGRSEMKKRKEDKKTLDKLESILQGKVPAGSKRSQVPSNSSAPSPPKKSRPEVGSGKSADDAIVID